MEDLLAFKIIHDSQSMDDFISTLLYMSFAIQVLVNLDTNKIKIRYFFNKWVIYFDARNEQIDLLWLWWKIM